MPNTRVLLRSLAAIAFLVSLGLSSQALAQAPDAAAQAKEHYDKGITHYNLGRFDDAVAEFQKAYELQSDPVLLFNIAQAYRQKQDPEKAIFFYKRYLTLAPNAPNKNDVNKRIKELEEIKAKQEENKGKPPQNVGPDGIKPPPEGNGNNTKPPPEHHDVALNNNNHNTPPEDPPEDTDPEGSLGVTGGVETGKAIRLGLIAGPVFPSFSSEHNLNTPSSLFSLDIGGSYGLAFGQVAVDLGARFNYSPLPYSFRDMMTNMSVDKTSSLVGLLADVGARYAINPSMDLRGDVAFGVTWWSGLVEGNPFTQNGVGASGAVPMPTVHFGVAFDYTVWQDLYLSAAPGFTWSRTTSSGLRAETKSISHFDLLFGLGYSL